jgi:Na+-transporting NADH:ubiquinone oxidoreductase subunit NqrD
MFGSSAAHDLGYASTAIIIALIRELVGTGTLNKDQAADVLDNAVSALRPMQNIGSIAGAMRIVNDVKSRVAA